MALVWLRVITSSITSITISASSASTATLTVAHHPLEGVILEVAVALERLQALVQRLQRRTGHRDEVGLFAAAAAAASKAADHLAVTAAADAADAAGTCAMMIILTAADEGKTV